MTSFIKTGYISDRLGPNTIFVYTDDKRRKEVRLPVRVLKRVPKQLGLYESLLFKFYIDLTTTGQTIQYLKVENKRESFM